MSRPRPRLNFKSLNVETDTETKFLQVSVSRLRPRLNLHSLNVETETETKSLWVSMSRPRPRLNLQSLNVETETETEFTKSQYRDWDRDWIYNLYLPIFTYIYLYLPIFTTYIYLYLPIFTTYILRFSLCWDRDSSRLLNSVVVETETHRDWEFLWLLRPRLIETGKFCGCRDRDSSRLGNSVVSRPRLIETGKFCGCRDRDSSRLGISVVVETETSRDWTKVVETETSSRVSLIQLHEFSPFAPLISKFSLFWPKIYKIVAIFAKSHAIFREEVAGRP